MSVSLRKILSARTQNASCSHLPLLNVLFFFALTGLVAGVLSPHAGLAQNTYVVTVESDDGSIDDCTADGSGDCSLRAALDDANATTTHDVIEFAIPQSGSVATIAPSQQFTITEPVTVDGTTSPEYPSSVSGPAIVIDGSSATDNGFVIDTDNATIDALGVNNFPDEGIQVNSGYTNVIIRNCFVGIDITDGETEQGNLTSPSGSINAGIIVRGASTVEHNLVSANEGDGIYVGGDNNTISNNLIGLDHEADVAKGNSANGIHIQESNNLVEADTIAGNGGAGVLIFGDDNEVRTNHVGTNGTGTAFPNDTGILIIAESSTDPAENNVIGYSASASFSTPHPSDGGNGNVIANNSTRGVIIAGDGSTGNAVRGNSIHRNGASDDTDIGIDLLADGVTMNDGDDADTGPNNLQNFPVIDDVVYNSSTEAVSVTYRVETTTTNASYPLKIDFYAVDSGTSGEGEIYLDTQEYTAADAGTQKTHVIDLGAISTVTSEDHLVATATDDAGNTSEFLSATSPLPVELASFGATQVDRHNIEVTWTTASETNNAGFRVQHKAGENSPWKNVSYVESEADGGTTNEATAYRFTAEDLEVGTHQFRLKQLDVNGTEHAHDAVTVELKMREALRLSAPAPHPIQNQATVSFAVREQTEATITVYNTLGQQVAILYRGTPSTGERQSVNISTNELSSGVYFLRLQADGQTRSERMTVVR